MSFSQKVYRFNEKYKIDLLLIIAVLIAANIPLLTGKIPIQWDSFSIFKIFSISYNSIFYDGSFPLWLPYDSYGLPNYFWLSSLSIFDFLFIGIGKLFLIKDSLLLFKYSLLFEQLIAVFGMYLFSKLIFQKRTTCIITCLAFIATFSVYRQVQFNFRLVYLLPLILYWIILFFQRKSSIYLWMTGITMILAVPGSSFYPLVIEYYAVGLFALVLFIYESGSIRSLFRSLCKFSWKSLLAFCALITLSILLLYYFKTFNDGISLNRVGRGDNAVADLGSFLSFWKTWNPVDLSTSFLYGLVSTNITNTFEYSFYIGLLPLAGVFAAALFNRKKIWIACLLSGLFLFVFSLRGIFSFAAYYLPAVNLSRYVAILGTIPFRTFLIIGAGFGLDMDLSLSQWKKVGISLFIFILAIDLFGNYASTNSEFSEILANPQSYVIDIKLFLIRLAAYLVFVLIIWQLNSWKKKKASDQSYVMVLTKLGLILVVIIDLGLFRYNYETKTQSFFSDFPIQSTVPSLVEPLEYQDQRLSEPDDKETQAKDFLASSFQPVTNWSEGSFIQFDRCVPYSVSQLGYFDIYSSSLQGYVDTPSLFMNSEGLSGNLKQVFGCENPKLKVVANVFVSPSDEDAVNKINTTDDLSNLLILSKKYSALESSINNASPVADIQVLNYSFNQIEIEVINQNDGGWLIYSDPFHPDWVATVNGKAVTIERAYLAFKAVPLVQGNNVVIFTYGSPFKRLAYSTLAILFGTAALILLGGIVFVLLSELGLSSWLQMNIKNMKKRRDNISQSKMKI